MLPLFIFEPRYRAMLAHCLEQNRMFCVALMKPGVTEAAGPDDFSPWRASGCCGPAWAIRMALRTSICRGFRA